MKQELLSVRLVCAKIYSTSTIAKPRCQTGTLNLEDILGIGMGAFMCSLSSASSLKPLTASWWGNWHRLAFPFTAPVGKLHRTLYCARHVASSWSRRMRDAAARDQPWPSCELSVEQPATASDEGLPSSISTQRADQKKSFQSFEEGARSQKAFFQTFGPLIW